MSTNNIPSLEEAKARLDLIINKARVDLYKPIQIAEVLYQSRMGMPGIDINNLETYRIKSIYWRNDVCRRLLGKISTSSARYQDNVWEANAMTTVLLVRLDTENKQTRGAVEKYIYLRFQEKQQTLASIMTIVESADPHTFEITSLFAVFQTNKAIRRSIDKVYEIVVYSLLETVVVALDAQVTISVPQSHTDVLAEFADIATILLGLSVTQHHYTTPAHVYRVGVTNAADRGLDMWTNFGPAIQVKHLSLDPKLAEEIVDQIESDNIMVVCRTADKQVIQAVINQISWGRKVRGIVTEANLADWYARCLRGKYTNIFATELLQRMLVEFKKEFPQAAEVVDFLEERSYLQISSPELWVVDLVKDAQQFT